MQPSDPINPTPISKPEQPAAQPDVEAQISSTTPELQPSPIETQPGTVSSGAAATVAPSTPDPVVSQAQPPPPTTAVTPATTPANLPATDSDLIEKHWVDQAEHIIEADKDDPQKEETDEQNLSDQYLKQRFGFDVDKDE